MYKDKLHTIINAMKEENLSQLILTDPSNIFYLTGKWIYPGERLLALYMNTSGEVKLVINKLFPQSEDLGMELIWYDDTEDAVERLSHYVKEGRVGIDRTWPAGFLLRLQQLKKECSYCNGSLIVDHVRMIKNRKEQELMRKAALANDQVMEKLISLVGKGYTEKELNRIVKELYSESGHQDVAFEPITAYGKSGANPHHVTDDTKGKKGDCVVLDIGGILNHYCSDMTRTVFLGEASERAKEIYEIVKEAQRRGIQAAKPGNRMCDVDFACRNYIEEKGFGDYFTHRTGHSIGIEDHEFGDVSLANTEIIKPGQCFSIEPGIYIQEEEIGVRIEDIVLITEDGCEVLNQVTKELTIVPLEE